MLPSTQLLESLKEEHNITIKCSPLKWGAGGCSQGGMKCSSRAAAISITALVPTSCYCSGPVVYSRPHCWASMCKPYEQSHNSEDESLGESVEQFQEISLQSSTQTHLSQVCAAAGPTFLEWYMRQVVGPTTNIAHSAEFSCITLFMWLCRHQELCCSDWNGCCMAYKRTLKTDL